MHKNTKQAGQTVLDASQLIGDKPFLKPECLLFSTNSPINTLKPVVSLKG